MATAIKNSPFDVQTNSATTEFTGISSSDVYNKASETATVVPANIETMVDGNKAEPAAETKKKIDKTVNPGKTRKTKDLYSTWTDLKKAPQAYVDGIADKLFPGEAVVLNTFKQIGKQCRAKLLGGLSQCRNKKASAKWNGKIFNTSNRSCSPDQLANLVNKIAKGAYQAALIDPCALSKMVFNLSSRALEVGLPGVFSTLSTQMFGDSKLIAQTGAMVLTSAAINKNINGVIDVANSSIGKFMNTISPAAGKKVLRNYRTPKEIGKRDKKGFYTTFKSTMEILDPEWSTTKQADDTIPSIMKMDRGNSDLTELFKMKAHTAPTEIRLDGTVATPTHEMYIYATLAARCKHTDTRKSLKQDLKLGTIITDSRQTVSNIVFVQPNQVATAYT
jgi:hypothetical protein